MKKIALLLGIIASVSVAAQDIIKYQDPWYLFHEYDSLHWIYPNYTDFHSSNRTDFYSLGSGINNLQQYTLPNGETTIYGIAVTATNFPLSDLVLQYAPIMRIYRQAAPGLPPTIEQVDSVTVYQTRRQVFFNYVTTGDNNPGSHVVRSFEFYFDTPVQANLLADTFYISIIQKDWMLDSSHVNFDSLVWYPIIPSAVTSHLYQWGTIPEYVMDTLIMCFKCGPGPHYSGETSWGFIFPIVGLRCVAPWLRLVERGDRSATVSWSQAEAGISYELSYGAFGSEPDAGTIITSTDTSYTLTDLPGGVREAVWVRKACNYATADYDTVVWSDWSAPLVFLTLGIGEVDDEDVRLYACGQRVVVEGLAGDEEVWLYDTLGRMVAAIRATGGTATLTAPAAGVYTVRIGTHAARSIIVTP